ncbi:MAG TPA: hypothetical protein VED17_04540, partial [Nitrososphaerales archaeon]|nr:hypothetical protein [Nitrososphaerales archaeon]
MSWKIFSQKDRRKLKEAKTQSGIITRHGKRITVSHRGGILVKTGGYSLALDPKRASKSDFSFVSHAHIDHVHSPDGNSKVIASKETVALAKVRGYRLKDAIEQQGGIDLVDA